jgi:acyl dehydratase
VRRANDLPIRVDGVAGLLALEGREIGVTGWRLVTQEDVSAFGAITGDEYWLHVDPERAAESRFGGTIAHGYFTLSLGPGFMYELWTLEGISAGVNYGLDKVRFPAPVPIGQRVRMRARLDHVEELGDGAGFGVTQTFELEGQTKPVCVAAWLARVFT